MAPGTVTDCCHKSKCPRNGGQPQQDSKHQLDDCVTMAMKITSPVNQEFKETALDVTPVHPTEGVIREFAEPTSYIEPVISRTSPPDRNILNVSFLI